MPHLKNKAIITLVNITVVSITIVMMAFASMAGGPEFADISLPKPRQEGGPPHADP